jgi:Ala-tRNA(Pro) deacylase
VRAHDSFILAVLPASSTIDLDRLRHVVGASEEIRLATADELLATFPDCEPGVVPPFGRLYGLSTVVDTGFSEIGDIVVSANTRHEGLWMHFCDFAAVEEPEQASFSKPIVAGAAQTGSGQRDENRRAG